MGRRKGEQERHLAQRALNEIARDAQDELKTTFLSNAVRDSQLMYNALLKSALGEPERDIPPDPRSIKIWYEYAHGKPKEEQGGLIMEAFREVLKAATETRQAEVSERYIDVE